MEPVLLWVTIFGVIVIPLVGWAFNTLITKKIDNINDTQSKDRELFFKRLDEEHEHMEQSLKEYVRKDLYEQSMKHHKENEDAVFTSLLGLMNTRFASLDATMISNTKDIQALEGKIDQIKDLINNKLNKGGPQ